MGFRKSQPVLRPLRDHEFMTVLQNEVDRYRNDAAAAKALGVSRGHLSRVLRDLKPVTARIAHALGYQIEPLFVPYEERR
jgi:DNA-binding phage protein